MKVVFFAVVFNFNYSFAECNTDSNLRLIKFPPTDLAIYLTPESTVEKVDHDSDEHPTIDYTVNYKGKPIHMRSIFNHPNNSLGYYPDTYKVLPLTNISDNAKLIKRQNEKEVYSFIDIDIEPENIDSVNQVFKSWSTSISFSSPDFDDPIGDEFAKSLFIDKNDCLSVSPDSVIYNGPQKLYFSFLPDSSKFAKDPYSDISDRFYTRFSDYANRENLKVYIEAHADKTEVGVNSEAGQEYSLILSQRRAEEVRSVLVNKFGLNPDNIKEVKGFGMTKLIAPSDVEEGRKMNRRAIAYIGRGNMSDK